jgi:DNA-binding transcriptional ArsR family regulator
MRANPQNPPATDILTRASLFALLGYPTRLQILLYLQEHGPTPVGALVAATRTSYSAISQHLTKLKAGGLVSCKRGGGEEGKGSAQEILYDICEDAPYLASVLAVCPTREETARRLAS